MEFNFILFIDEIFILIIEDSGKYRRIKSTLGNYKVEWFGAQLEFPIRGVSIVRTLSAAVKRFFGELSLVNNAFINSLTQLVSECMDELVLILTVLQ